MNQRSIVAVILASQICLAQNAPAPPPSSQSPAVPPASTTAPAIPEKAAAPPVEAEAVDQTQEPQTVVLREGTPVQLKFAQSLSSKTAAENDPVAFALAEDLVVNGTVLAKEGAYATGTVSYVQRSGKAGKAGELGVVLSHMKCGKQRIKLRGLQDREGEGKVATAVAFGVLFGLAGILSTRGENVEIKEGTPIVAYVDEDYELPPIVEASK